VVIVVKKKFTGLSMDKLNEALQGAKVRNALEARANRALPAIKATAYAAGADEFAQALHVETGTRPGTGAKDGLKRPYARVVAEITPEMDKADRGASLSRRKIMRRGASNG
jgi:hypothetical protein